MKIWACMMSALPSCKEIGGHRSVRGKSPARECTAASTRRPRSVWIARSGRAVSARNDDTISKLTARVNYMNEVLATAFFATFLENSTILSAIVVVLFIMAPLGMSYEAASASSDCDLLSDALTDKRMNGPSDDHDHEHALSRAEKILDRQNTKQGLGFVVGERVVDLKTLNDNIVATIFGIGTTVVPILFSLRPDAGDGDIISGSDACALTSTQVTMIQSSMLARNETCSFNQTLSDILAM
jgi:hypothetical protein